MCKANRSLTIWTRSLDESKNPAHALAVQSVSGVRAIIPFYPYAMLTTGRVQQCAEALGFSLISDTNSPDALCDGFATLDVTVNQNRQRMSTFDAFIPRDLALQRIKNLHICTGTVVSRIEFSGKGNAYRAERVRFQSAKPSSDASFSVLAKREVIVCSGAIGSPQVYCFSTIFPNWR